jgi:hypothetical protein
MSAGVVSHRRSQTAATDETEAAEPREWDPGGAASLPWRRRRSQTAATDTIAGRTPEPRFGVVFAA